MIDTCNGCGKHPSVCMCRTTSPPDVEELHNRNKPNLVDKLRETASAVKQSKIDRVKDRIVEFVVDEAKTRAALGDFSLTVWLYQKGWSSDQAKAAAEILQKEGFKCEVTSTRTAQYSNTDWDEEDVMHVSWE